VRTYIIYYMPGTKPKTLMDIPDTPWVVDYEGKRWLAYGPWLKFDVAWNGRTNMWEVTLLREWIRPYNAKRPKYATGVVGDPHAAIASRNQALNATFTQTFTKQYIDGLKASLDAKLMSKETVTASLGVSKDRVTKTTMRELESDPELQAEVKKLQDLLKSK